MNATFTQLIDKDSVIKTYSGAMGCACGCKGTYAEEGTAVTRRVNEVNKALATGQIVKVYNFAEKVCYEYIKPNGRVVRVYVEKN